MSAPHTAESMHRQTGPVKSISPLPNNAPAAAPLAVTTSSMSVPGIYRTQRQMAWSIPPARPEPDSAPKSPPPSGGKTEVTTGHRTAKAKASGEDATRRRVPGRRVAPANWEHQMERGRRARVWAPRSLL
eukprot:54038-Rhodomonas_salina.1